MGYCYSSNQQNLHDGTEFYFLWIRKKSAIVTLPLETSAATGVPKEGSSVFLRFRSGSESLKSDSSPTKVIKFLNKKGYLK